MEVFFEGNSAISGKLNQTDPGSIWFVDHVLLLGNFFIFFSRKTNFISAGYYTEHKHGCADKFTEYICKN
jgi:hypothetical protein